MKSQININLTTHINNYLNYMSYCSFRMLTIGSPRASGWTWSR